MRVPVTADERHPVRGHHRGARDGRLCTPSLPPATSTTTTTTRGNPMGRAEKQSQKTYKCGWMGRLHLPSAHFLVRDGGNPLRNSANISTSEANALIRWDLETKKNTVASKQRCIIAAETLLILLWILLLGIVPPREWGNYHPTSPPGLRGFLCREPDNFLCWQVGGYRP